MTAEGAARWRVGDGEEARLTPGAAAAAEVWSRGFLPLRVRSEGTYRLRPAFPGTAVVLGASTYEVLNETTLPEEGLVVYRLRPWPEGEVVRDRVLYGPAFVRAAEAERERARARARARPWRFVLYPLVGLLPEDQQERLSDRLGLYAVTATLVSGLAESLGLVLLALVAARTGDVGRAIGLLLGLPGLVLLVLPGLGRAFGAVFLRETAGSAPVVLAFDALRALGAWRRRRDSTFVPLTRAAFWERLSRPDTVEGSDHGALVLRGLLPHLTWERGHRLSVGRDHWQAWVEPPRLEGGRLVYTYRLEPPGEGSEAGRAPDPPAATAYADEVLAGVRREWDDWNASFVWYTSLLAADVQARAFEHRGGPHAARRPTVATAALLGLLGLYLLAFLPGGPAADPLAPLVLMLGGGLVLDSGRRLLAVRGGRYAPSLFRRALPSDILRPERVAYHAHRDAERRALDELKY